MVIILAIWIYVIWVVILLGTEVTHSVQYYSSQKYADGKLLTQNYNYISPLGILTLFFTVATHFHTGKGACSSVDVARIVGVPQLLVNKILERFKAAALIYKVEGDTKGYLPARWI